MISKFLTVAVGKIYVASRSILGGSVMFFVTVGGPTSKTSVFVKFKLRELELSQVFNSLTHVNRVAVW